ncbi:leucine-rich repeat domain-containing protein [Muribaculaceae bacterium Isolate-013 (NCI)]|nr:leucine-rich repeat domain-containing protein [Muribaculaceae bacterium Isolate-013 (NCI)]
MKKTLLYLTLSTCTLLPAYAAIPDGGWSVTPKNGSTVDKITEITVSKTNEHYMDPYINRSVKINGEAISVTQKVTNNGGTVVMTLASPVEKSGTYEIVVPSRMFTYGYSMWGDEEDNPEMSWTVTVDNPDQPIGPVIPDIEVTADPESGSTVKLLESVTVKFGGAASATVAADASVSASVTSLGAPVDVAVSFSAAADPDAVTVTFSPAVASSGEYTLTLPEGLFDLTADGGGEAFASPEVKLNYTVKAPPAVGEKFVVDNIRYIVLSRELMTAAVTWPDNEDDYASLTTVPTSVTLDGETFAVTEIGSLAFSEVRGISSFKVPEGITAIGDAAFWSSSLESIEIPPSVTAIGESAFEECKSLKEFTLPATVTSVGSDMFYGCASLESVTLPEGLAAIPDNFLAGCVILKEVTIPSTVREFGEFSLSECSTLTTTNIPEGTTKLGRFAFAKCPLLTRLDVPETVTEMGHGVFYETGLTEASLPENITVIPDGTFQCCTDLEEFVVGPNVTEIETQAFYWCFKLKKIVFGEKVATLGTELFKGDDAIAEVICLGAEPATGAEFPQAVYDNATLTVPEGAAEAYRNAPGWKEFKNIHTVSSIDVAAVADGVQLSVEGDMLGIVADTDVTVTDVSGRVLYCGRTGAVALSRGSVYLVTAGGKTIKFRH